jgi:hypothetical protein
MEIHATFHENNKSIPNDVDKMLVIGVNYV